MTRLPTALKPLWPYAKRAYTVSTRLVAPATIRLSRLRGGYEPQSVAATIDEAVSASGELHIVAPGERIVRTAPHGTPAGLPTFADQTTALIRRQAVAALPQGRVLGPYRAVVTAQGVLVDELVRYFGTSRPLEHPVFLHPFPGPPEHIHGSLGVLASRGDANYFHFLVDVLPRISTLERCPGIAQPERWYVPARTRFQRELLSLAGIDSNRIVDSDEVPHVRADLLLVPTVPDLDLEIPSWVVAFLRERLLPDGLARVPGRNVYVTRGHAPHTRRLTNEDDVVGMLSRHGFDVVDPSTLSVAEQIATFATADVIVAPHGAALANLAFASAGASVLEIFPPDFVQGCYWKHATGVDGLNYRYLVGSGRAPRNGVMAGATSDIVVSPDDVERALDALLADSASASTDPNGAMP